ncbi:MAG TPA: hypothetical protein VJ720_13815 [Chitinophaga sp.]|nr:hypothetical protein [Chitinophaga sp.]
MLKSNRDAAERRLNLFLMHDVEKLLNKMGFVFGKTHFFKKGLFDAVCG